MTNPETHRYCERSLGSLRDLHLHVLEALLPLTPEDPVILKKLSRLYCLLREFPRAQHLWERYTEVTQGQHIKAMKTYKHGEFYETPLSAPPAFETGFGYNQKVGGGPLGAGTAAVGFYSVDAAHDRVKEASRRDFTGFSSGDTGKRSYGDGPSQASGGQHVGATTVLYALPPGGWSDETKAFRREPGGMRAALSGGQEGVEKEIKRVGGGVIMGYGVERDKVHAEKNAEGLARATVNNKNVGIGCTPPEAGEEDEYVRSKSALSQQAAWTPLGCLDAAAWTPLPLALFCDHPLLPPAPHPRCRSIIFSLASLARGGQPATCSLFSSSALTAGTPTCARPTGRSTRGTSRPCARTF